MRRLSAAGVLGRTVSAARSTSHNTASGRKVGAAAALLHHEGEVHPQWDLVPDTRRGAAALYAQIAERYDLCDPRELCFGVAQAYTAVGDAFSQQRRLLAPSDPVPPPMVEAMAALATPRFAKAAVVEGMDGNLRCWAGREERVVRARIVAVRVDDAYYATPAREQIAGLSRRHLSVDVNLTVTGVPERLATDLEQFEWLEARLRYHDRDDAGVPTTTRLARRNVALYQQQSWWVRQGFGLLRHLPLHMHRVTAGDLPSFLRGLGRVPVTTTKSLTVRLCDGPGTTAAVDRCLSGATAHELAALPDPPEVAVEEPRAGDLEWRVDRIDPHSNIMWPAS